MDVRSVLREFSALFHSFFYSHPDKKSQAQSAETSHGGKDRFVEISRDRILRDAFGDGAGRKSSWERQSPWLYSPFALLSVAGCGGDDSYHYDSGSDDGPPDGGTGGTGDGGVKPTFPDKDSDGFTSDIDCDDSNPNKIPLKENGVVTVDRSVTICPGTYERARLFVKHRGDYVPIQIDAAGVSLDNYSLGTSSVAFDGAFQATLTGIKIYSNAGPAIHVKGNQNTIQDIEIHGEYGTGIRLENCQYTKILSSKLDGLDSFVNIEGGSNNLVENSTFLGGGIGTIDRLRISGHDQQIKNNILEGVGIHIEPSAFRCEIRKNKITGMTSYHGIFVEGDDNDILENVSQSNGHGIYLSSSACDNIVKYNDVQFNNIAGVFSVNNGVCTNTVSDNIE